jgi:Ni,Fe-hydrogenase I cytochrome b subunit
MKFDRKILKVSGFLILILIISSYFIPYTSVKEGSEFEATYETPLLGVLIFHNEFVFCVYILIAFILIYFGFKREKSCYTKRK